MNSGSCSRMSSTQKLVCYTAVFSVVTQRSSSGEERCVMTLKTKMAYSQILTRLWVFLAVKTDFKKSLKVSCLTGFISPSSASPSIIFSSSQRAASINRPCTRTPSSGDSNSSSIGRVWSGSSLDRASLTSSWLRYMGNTLKWKDNWSMGRLYLRAWFWRVPVKKPSDNKQFND